MGIKNTVYTKEALKTVKDVSLMIENRKRDNDLKMMKIPNSEVFVHMVYMQYKDQIGVGTFLEYFKKVSGWILSEGEETFIKMYPVNIFRRY